MMGKSFKWGAGKNRSKKVDFDKRKVYNKQKCCFTFRFIESEYLIRFPKLWKCPKIIHCRAPQINVLTFFVVAPKQLAESFLCVVQSKFMFSTRIVNCFMLFACKFAYWEIRCVISGGLRERFNRIESGSNVFWENCSCESGNCLALRHGHDGRVAVAVI